MLPNDERATTTDSRRPYLFKRKSQRAGAGPRWLTTRSRSGRESWIALSRTCYATLEMFGARTINPPTIPSVLESASRRVATCRSPLLGLLDRLSNTIAIARSCLEPFDAGGQLVDRHHFARNVTIDLNEVVEETVQDRKRP